MFNHVMINPDEVIIDLYTVIDNIDTLSDMTKGNYEAFYKGTMKEVEKSKKYFSLVMDILHGMEPVND